MRADRAKKLIEVRVGQIEPAGLILKGLFEQVMLDGNYRTYNVSYYEHYVSIDDEFRTTAIPGVQICEREGPESVVWLSNNKVIHYLHEKQPQVDLANIEFDEGHIARFYAVAHEVLSRWPDNPRDYIRVVGGEAEQED